MTERWSERRNAAIHQAGHAVAAFKLGKPLGFVTIAPDKDQFGCVRFAYPDWFTPRLKVNEPIWPLMEDHVMVWLAGVAAEDAWCRDVSDRANKRNARLTIGAENDLPIAVNVAELTSPDTLEGHIERLRHRVLGWVGPNGVYASLVYELASELEKAQELTGLEAEIFLTEAEAEGESEIGDD